MTIDYLMPVMDGVTLGIILRELYQEARIALLTANIQKTIENRAKEAKMLFLKKPITRTEILDFVE